MKDPASAIAPQGKRPRLSDFEAGIFCKPDFIADTDREMGSVEQSTN